MNKVKKSVSLVLSILLLIGVIAVAPITAGATSGEEFSYYSGFYADTVIISAYNGDSANVEIPSYIDGKTVVGIEDVVFEECETIVSVTIPDTVEDISVCTNEYAVTPFYNCPNLKTVKLGKSVEFFDAFSSCDNLESFEVDPENPHLSSVDGVLFDKDKSLLMSYPAKKSDKTYDIPDTVTKLKEFAFCGNTYLENVNIPESVNTISRGAFDSCEKLKSIVVPDSVKEIGEAAFADCVSLDNITIPKNLDRLYNSCFDNTGYANNPDNWEDDMLYIDSYLIKGGDKYSKVYNVKEGTRVIADHAFGINKNITGVIIPDSVEVIGASAFVYCENLASVSFGKGLKNIWPGAFYGCEKLDKVEISDIGVWCNIDYTGDDVFKYSRGFYHNGELVTDLVIPEGVDRIGGDAFTYCENLKSVTIPDSVNFIGVYAFEDCVNLEKINLPDTAVEIQDRAFKNTAYIKNTDNWEDGVIYNGNHLIDTDKSHSGEFVVKDNTLDIAYGAFDSNKNLTSVKLPDSLEYISDEAFAFCSGLKSIVLPDRVQKIGGESFANCVSLVSITIPKSVITISGNAFRSCDSLKDVYYAGSRSDWNKIYSGNYFNDSLSKADIHFAQEDTTESETTETTVEPTETETATAEPTETETVTVEPTETETATVEPTETETATVEPTETETATADPTETETTTVEPTDTQTATAETTETESTTAEPTQTESTTSAPTNSQAAAATTESKTTAKQTVKPVVKPKANTIKVAAKTKTVKADKLKKGKVTVKKAIKVTGAKGIVTFKKLSGSKKLTISKKGVITVRKGKYKKGKVLKMKVRVTASGNAKYTGSSKTVKVKIKIK